MLGKRFNLYVLKDYLIKLWGFSSFEIIDIPNNYFVIRFQDPELWRAQYKKVLYDGPWVIRGHCVLIQRWTPYFNPYHNPLGRVATWVCIPDVPLHLYNKHYIYKTSPCGYHAATCRNPDGTPCQQASLSNALTRDAPSLWIRQVGLGAEVGL